MKKEKKTRMKKAAAFLLAMVIVFFDCLPYDLHGVQAAGNGAEEMTTKQETGEAREADVKKGEIADGAGADALAETADAARQKEAEEYAEDTETFTDDDGQESGKSEIYESEGETGEVNFAEAYTKQAPLRLTYGAPGTTEAFTLRDGDGVPVEDELSDVSVTPDHKGVLHIAVNRENKTITFVPLKVSGGPVRVRLSMETEKGSFEKALYIEVTPMPLTVRTDSIFVSAPGKDDYGNVKIYDAGDRVDVKATLEAREGLAVTAEAAQEIEQYLTDVIFRNYASGRTDVQGENEVQAFTFAPRDLSLCTGITDAEIRNNYTIERKEGAEPVPLIIKKRKLHLAVADGRRPFRSLAYTKPLQTLVYADSTGDETGFAGNDSPEMEGFSFPTVIDTTARGLTEENVRTGDTAVYGRHTAALTLDTATGNATGNYDFEWQNYGRGELVIAEERDAGDYVTVDNGLSTRVWETVRDGSPARYLGREAWIQFSLTGGYNKIYLVDGTDITDTGLAGSALMTDASGCVCEQDFYLVREESNDADRNAPGKVTAKTEPFRLSFICDQDAPICGKIAFGLKNKVISDLASVITFGIFHKKQIVADVSFDDAGAGVKEWSYYIATTDRDGTYEKLLENAVFQTGTEDYRIFVGTLSEGQTLEEGNNYIVFVKVTDHVGNTKIYGSDGVVLENFHDISVGYTEKAAESTGSKGIWNHVAYYSGDAALVLKAEENAGGGRYYSGLKNMRYVVSRHYGDGTILTDQEETVITKAAEDHAVLPVFPGGMTLAGLREYCTITKTLNFANDRQKSQVITVSAAASDHAGNTMERPSRYTIVLDAVRPVVTSSHTQVNNHTKLANGFYANSHVTYDVAVRERFLKTLRVAVNGVFYTLAELEAQKEHLGIESVTKDAGADILRTTDETVYRFAITFAADGEYTVQTTATDAAGNDGRDCLFRFIIDTVKPELELIYTACHMDGAQTVLDVSGGRAYANETVSHVMATAVITERNFDPENTGLVVKATDSGNKEIQIDDYGAAFYSGWINKGRVSETDSRYVYELTLPAIQVDANYTFTYSYTDLAGNALETVQTHTLTLDRVRPGGAVTVENLVNGTGTAAWEKLLRVITFGLFGKNRVRVSLTGADETAGVDSVWYLVSDTVLNKSSLEKRRDWKEYKNKKTFKANRYLIVYGKIIDKAGNIQYISTDGIILDHKTPGPVVKAAPAAPGWGRGVYGAKDAPGFRVSVMDSPVKGVYAGLKRVTYRIVNGTNGYTKAGILAEWKETAHRQQWTGHVGIDPIKFYSNDVRITVSAEDWSGNAATSGEIHMKVDSKAPAVRFSFDKNDGQNGKYYKKDKKLIITVEERNFDVSYRPKVSSSAGGGYRIGKWTHRGETHTAVITFTGDSDYTVSYSCYDLAGNKSNREILQEFTVDKTAPVITVAYDNHDAQNGSYYREARTATITVVERNVDPAQIMATVTVSSGSAPRIGGWSGAGDIHTARISFRRDADYTFRINGTDLAGNPSAGVPQEQYTIDLTAPEIIFDGVKDQSANNGTVAPAVRIRDSNFAAGSTEVTLRGANRGEQDVDRMAAMVADNSGMTIQFENFAENMDDIYTLTCKSADRAGNESAASVRFSVNRDGSTYEIDQDTQKMLDEGYISRPQDVVVTEINTDDLRTTELSYSREGRIVILREGTDYTVEKSGGLEQWKKYKYRIYGTCFEAEGAYDVNIYSEDAAHNTATNKSKAKTLAFTVDRTAPTMAVANLTDGGRYREESHLFTLHAKDNILLDYVEVRLNGKRVYICRGDELIAAGGEIRMAVPGSPRYQTVELTSCDKAGNIGREVYDPKKNKMAAASYRVLVTADRFVQFMNNRLLLTGFALSVAAIAILLILLAVKRRKIQFLLDSHAD